MKANRNSPGHLTITCRHPERSEGSPAENARSLTTLGMTCWGVTTNLSIVMVAVLAVLLSMFPLIFQHKSLMSPNIGGAVFLYDKLPTLPNYTDSKKINEHGADVGAMPWQFFPLTVMQARAVKVFHEFPLWNRYNSTGVTQIGQGQMMLGDPFNGAMWLGGANAATFDLKFIVLRFIFAWALGLSVWTLTRHLPASWLITFSAPFIGYFIGRLNHAEVFVLCYAPLILLGWFKLITTTRDQARIKWLIGLMLANWLVFHSGSAKESYLLLPFLNGIGAACFIAARAQIQPYFKLWCFLILGTGSCFALMTLPFWGVFLDTLHRGTSSYASPAVGQAHGWEWLRVVDNITSYIRYHEYGLPALNSILFIGLVWGVMRLIEGKRSPQHAIATILTGSMVICLITAFKVIPTAFLLKIPFINNIYHVHTTFLVLMITPVCILAGMGFAYPPKSSKALWMPVAVWLSGMGLFALHLHGPQMGRHFLLYAGLFLPVFWFFPRLWIQLLHHKLTKLGWVAFVGLLFIGLGRGAFWPAWVKQDFVFKPPARVNLTETPPLIQALLPGLQKAPTRIIGLGDILLPGAQAIWGLETISGPDAMMDKAYRGLIAGLKLPTAWDWRLLFNKTQLKKYQNALNLLGVGIVLAHRHTLHDSMFIPLASDQVLTAYGRHSVWPRAFYTNVVHTYASIQDFATQVQQEGAHPFVSVSRETRQQVLTPSKFRAETEGTPIVVEATHYQLTNNATRFTINAPGPGVVYLGEAGDPREFQAFVNGKPVPLFTANYAFKAIKLDRAGLYQVVFDYWPSHFTAYVSAAAVGASLWLVLLGGAVVVFRRRD